ncbi:unnamed protein product [Spirodela intermedia]|uniref:J domain-containing protein n=1 Tax=Spirodela intermedia TaxID=51605 RepID=A0A7I8LJF1_SPIIN|nr:unnamed protein product [Spirodela intermedia]
MGVDYYKLLQIGEDAGEEEIRKAYRRLAMKWHPDKNPRDNKEAEAKFKQISEACDVLTDPLKRAAYDEQWGRGRKGKVPPAAGGRGGGSSSDGDEMFSEFYGSSGTFRRGGGGGGSGRRAKWFPGAAPARFGENLFRKIFGDEEDFASYQQPRKAEPIERYLSCSLEELFNGTTKKMKITRLILDASGRTLPVDEILPVDIRRGWKKGTRITFPEKGDEALDFVPADIVFIIDEKPHGVFTREDNDLVFTKRISLAEALTGFTVRLTTLDGRELAVDVDDVVHPGYEKVVAGEGMPVGKDSSRRGNLRIRFVTVFPAKLTATQKSVVRRMFTG